MSSVRDKVVFFAKVSESMRNYKEILAKELISAGCIVSEAPEEPQDFRELVSRADLAVHLLSDEDSSPNSLGKGIEEAQIHLSLQENLTQRIIAGSSDNCFTIYAWHQKATNGNHYVEERIPPHLKKIEQLDEVELLRTGFDDFKYYLLRKISSEQSEDPDEFFIKGARNRNVYFMYDYADKPFADNYINQLNHRGFTVFTPSFDSDFISTRQSHARSLKKLDIAVVFARESSINWINMKVVDLLKIPGMARTREVLEIGIISTPEKIRQLTPMANKFKLISIEEGGVKEQLEELLKNI